MLREWRRVVGVWKETTQTRVHHLKKQQPQKARYTQGHTEAYKEAVVGIMMAIIHRHHPDVKLDQNQHDIIQEKIYLRRMKTL